MEIVSNKLKIEAVIFDIDGLMINSEILNAKSFVYAMKKFGYDFPNSLKWYFENGCGCRRDVVSEKIKMKLPTNADFSALIKYFISYRTQLLQKELKPKKGLFELLNFLKSKNIKMAIATSGIQEELELKLKSAGIPLSYFSEIVCGFDVKEPKPHPETYQIACKKLAVNPEKTIALEDSDYGIESAATAGLKAIYIPDVKINNPGTIKKAYRIVNSLDEVIPILDKIKTSPEKC